MEEVKVKPGLYLLSFSIKSTYMFLALVAENHLVSRIVLDTRTGSSIGYIENPISLLELDTFHFICDLDSKLFTAYEDENSKRKFFITYVKQKFRF